MRSPRSCCTAAWTARPGTRRSGVARVVEDRGYWFRTPEAYDVAGNFRATLYLRPAGDLGHRARAASARCVTRSRSAPGPAAGAPHPPARRPGGAPRREPRRRLRRRGGTGRVRSARRGLGDPGRERARASRRLPRRRRRPYPQPRGPEHGPDQWTLTWSDEFDGPAGAPPDPETWGYDLGDGSTAGIVGWGNNEREYYTDSPENAATDGEGHLLITVRTADGSERCYYGPCEYTSARLLTKDRLRDPVRPHRGSHQGSRRRWASGRRSGCSAPTSRRSAGRARGEIDIMEFVGRRPNEVLGTIHGPGYSGSSGLQRDRRPGRAGGRRLPHLRDRVAAGRDHLAPRRRRLTTRRARPTSRPTDWVFDHPFFLHPQRRRRREPRGAGRGRRRPSPVDDRRLRPTLPGDRPVIDPRHPDPPRRWRSTGRPPPPRRAASRRIDGERFAVIRNVDRLEPFLMSIVSDSDVWLFVGSNGPFTAGRRNADTALFPYQTADKILRHADTGGARTDPARHARRARPASGSRGTTAAGSTTSPGTCTSASSGPSLVFEEINHDLGLRFRWTPDDLRRVRPRARRRAGEPRRGARGACATSTAGTS